MKVGSPGQILRALVAVAVGLGAAAWLLSGLAWPVAIAGAAGYGLIAALIASRRVRDYWPAALLGVGISCFVIGPSHYIFGALAVAPWMALRIGQAWTGLQERIIREART